MNDPSNASGHSAAPLTTVERVIILGSTAPPAMIYCIMTPILQKMQMSLATGPNDAMLVRVALTVVGASMMIGSPLAGWVVDRIGVRRLTIASVFLWVGLGCLNYAIDDLHVLIASRFVEGLTATAAFVAGTTLLGKVTDDRARAQLIGFAFMIAAASGIITLLLAGVLGDINWRYAFFLHLLYLPILPFAFMLSENKIAAREAGGSIRELWQHFPVGLCVISFMAGGVSYAVSAYMPFRYHEIGVEKSTLVGVAMTAVTITTAFASATLGLTRRWFGARTSFQVSFGFAAVGGFLSAVLPGFWLTMAGQLVMGMGIGGMLPNIFSVASAAPLAYRGRITGAMKGAYCCAGLVMTVLLEPVMRLGGASAVMMSVGGVALCVGIAMAIVWRRQSRPALA